MHHHRGTEDLIRVCSNSVARVYTIEGQSDQASTAGAPACPAGKSAVIFIMLLLFFIIVIPVVFKTCVTVLVLLHITLENSKHTVSNKMVQYFMFT